MHRRFIPLSRTKNKNRRGKHLLKYMREDSRNAVSLNHNTKLRPFPRPRFRRGTLRPRGDKSPTLIKYNENKTGNVTPRATPSRGSVISYSPVRPWKHQRPTSSAFLVIKTESYLTSDPPSIWGLTNFLPVLPRDLLLDIRRSSGVFPCNWSLSHFST